MKYAIALIAVLLAGPATAELAWNTALEGEQRSADNRARDEFRHPRQTLEFFGLEQGMTVLEVAPGGGWYTEILAPLLAGEGRYYAAHYSLNPPSAYYRNSLGKFLQKLAQNQEVYGDVIVTQLQAPSDVMAAPAGSVDLAVTFRNVHSWLRSDTVEATFAAVYEALKPGGVFGVVQHRAKAGMSAEDMKTSGYVAENVVIVAAKAAGFQLEASSDINANPKDTADHPKGVWTLPPAFRLGDENRDHYAAIGESDRMTLKFVKPEK